MQRTCVLVELWRERYTGEARRTQARLIGAGHESWTSGKGNLVSASSTIAPQLITLWLRIRRLVGWGEPAERALALARMYFRGAAIMPFNAVLMVGFYALVLWHEHPHNLGKPSTLRFLADIAALWLTLGLLFFVAGLFALRRGRRAKASVPQVKYGRCFRVFEAHANSWEGKTRERKLSTRAGRPVPLYLFILVGPTIESAHWYLLPSDWNDAVPAPEAQVTMEIQPYTDLVIRLNDRNQYELLASMASDEQSLPAKPSRQERREVERARMRAGRGWGMTTAEAAKALRQMLWLTPVWLGTVGLGIAGVLFTDWIVYRILAGTFALLGIWVVIGWVMQGYRLIQVWRRVRQSLGPTQTVEGTVTGFTPVNPAADEDDQREIIWLARADGAPTSFVLGPSLYDDTLRAGQRVRIQYLAPNDVVVSVQPMEESTREQTGDMRSS
jgi:hypothetical protein